ncbi:MAG: heavy metal translocating P-type ATPase, partial [Chloroflexota bacterium]
RTIVLDKTGTITRGEPSVVEIVAADGTDATELLRVANAAEVSSEHPLARAIEQAADERGIEIDSVAGFESHTGRGVEAQLEGVRVLVGKPAYLAAEGVDIDALRDTVERLEVQAQTVVGVALGGRLLGFIGIADAVKEDAAAAITRMKDAGLTPLMISGDNERTALAVASQVGIDEVHAGVLPDEKARLVRVLQKQGQRVIMVGDGINDAPALTQADVGMAIGAGTDIAIESADVVILGGRLDAVMDAYEIGRQSYRKTKQNLALAFAFNGIGVTLAVTGLVHPVWAMIAMATSVSAVLLNSFGGRLISGRGTGHAEAPDDVALPTPGRPSEAA